MLGEYRISESRFEDGGAFAREIETPFSGGILISVPDHNEPIADVIFMDRDWGSQRIEAETHDDLVATISDDEAFKAIGVTAIQQQLQTELKRL